MRITKKQDRMPGIILTILLFVAEIAFTVLLLYTNLLSAKYIGIVFAVLLVLLLIDHLLIRKFRKQIRFWIGIILMVIILAVLGIASFYIYKTVSALDDITGVNKEITEINVYVKQDDAAQSLMDAASYSFGILADLDRENTDTALQQMASETGGEVSTKEYSSLTELADGLLKGDCQAIVLNRAYLDVFDEIDNYASFSSQIREIASEQVEKLVERNTPAPVQTDVQAEDSSDTTQDAAVTDQIYTIFVSGIDTRGDITASSRSDVNIVLTVNARTKQVLMISTPRDYYVPLSISNGVPDKLTHAGIYGINVCMDTLNMHYDTDINYYFRLNFAGFVQIIDALGGITVDSDYDFTTQNSSGYHFTKGPNQVNGDQALAFCRERYAFSVKGYCWKYFLFTSALPRVFRESRNKDLHNDGLVTSGLLEISHQLPCPKGFAVQVALAFMAALGDHIGFLFDRFDTFGDDLHAKAFTELDDGAHDGGIVTVIDEVLHKAFINLDFVQRQAFEVTQG